MSRDLDWCLLGQLGLPRCNGGLRGLASEACCMQGDGDMVQSMWRIGQGRRCNHSAITNFTLAPSSYGTMPHGMPCMRCDMRCMPYTWA